MNDLPNALGPEDAKIITLARSARARSAAAGGAAVRDADGRTYAGTEVELPSLKLSALEVVVAMAASSGASALEAAAVVTTAAAGDVDVRVVADLGGTGIPVYVAGADGTPVAALST